MINKHFDEDNEIEDLDPASEYENIIGDDID